MKLDHVAVSGETLDEAVAKVEAALGVAMQPGGRHTLFGTHNRLAGLADGLYLEAIAVDPLAPAPGRARWFDLDRFAGPARLSSWICRVDDIGAAPAAAGRPVEVARGDLRWSMAVPDDGALPFDGLFPAMICWRGGLHPARMLAPTGCGLRRLVVSHPQAAALRGQLAGFADPRVVIEPGPPELMAEFDTSHGRRRL